MEKFGDFCALGNGHMNRGSSCGLYSGLWTGSRPHGLGALGKHCLRPLCRDERAFVEVQVSNGDVLAHLEKYSLLRSWGEVGTGAKKMRLEKRVWLSAPSRQRVLRGACRLGEPWASRAWRLAENLASSAGAWWAGCVWFCVGGFLCPWRGTWSSRLKPSCTSWLCPAEPSKKLLYFPLREEASLLLFCWMVVSSSSNIQREKCVL